MFLNLLCIKCRNCSKLLAKVKGFNELEIKCPRCKNINSYMSAQSALPDCLEQLSVSGKIHDTNQ
ncbi:Com family DNA-binding transcriptional regulator [Acinetobacter sp. ANC 5502]